MRNSVSIALVMYGVLAVAATAAADNNKHKNNKFKFNELDKSGSIAEIIANFKDRKHDDDDDDDDDRRPIDPGHGDGKDPQNNPEPPKRPGFVWVGDHWERERAPASTSPQGRPGFVWVGDHWERERADKGTPAGPMIVNPVQGEIVVRDHRTPAISPRNGQGGVWVTETTGKPRPKRSGGGLLGTLGDAASGVGRGIGSAVSSAGNAVGSTLGNAVSGLERGAGRVGNAAGRALDGLTPGGSKPTPAPASGWTVVRDHRS